MFLNNEIKVNSCFVLNATTEIYEPKLCPEKFGFICKVRIKYATIFHGKNLSEKIYGKQIEFICNPHVNRFNDLSACLLHLF